MISHLSVVNLGATKVPQADGRWAIAVERAEVVPALAHLDTQRVLAPRGLGSQASKSSMIPSREEQRFRYERALAVSIEESLAAIPGVLEPRVHIKVPEEDPLFSSPDARLGSGSVLLVVDEDYGAADSEISALVAGAAGISREAVRVLKSVAPSRKSQPVAAAVEDVNHRVDVRVVSAVPWIVVAMGGALALAFGVKRVVRARVKRATFPLPKELDFEG